MNASLAILFLTVAFTLATRIEPWLQTWEGAESRGGGALSALLGDSRRMFANHFFVKADAYFHSGYYPSIYDNREAFSTAHMSADAGAEEDRNKGDEHEFLGAPLDVIDAFSRKFFPSEHTHLDEGGGSGTEGEHEDEKPIEAVREILPWLRISVELDPHRVESYVVASYWLRERMGRVNEAEAFLRDGLKANPDSYEILFDLGRIAKENRNDPAFARTLWELSLAKWHKTALSSQEPDVFFLRQILSYLSALEEEQGRTARAIELLEMASTEGQRPDLYADKLAELRAKLPAAQ